MEQANTIIYVMFFGRAHVKAALIALQRRWEFFLSDAHIDQCVWGRFWVKYQMNYYSSPQTRENEGLFHGKPSFPAKTTQKLCQPNNFVFLYLVYITKYKKQNPLELSLYFYCLFTRKGFPLWSHFEQLTYCENIC